jgi:hypothetical protein
MSKWHEKHHFKLNKHWPVLRKNQVSVELHCFLVNNENNDKLNKEIFENTGNQQLEENYFQSPTPEVFLLHILSHFLHHEQVEQYFLRSYYDTALWLHQQKDQLSLDTIKKYDQNYFHVPQLEQYLSLIVNLFQLKEDRFTLQTENTSRQVAEKLLTDGGKRPRFLTARRRQLLMLPTFKDKLNHLFHSAFPPKAYMQLRYPNAIGKKFYHHLYFYRTFSVLVRALKGLLSASFKGRVEH